jgi:hypothetical protein
MSAVAAHEVIATHAFLTALARERGAHLASVVCERAERHSELHLHAELRQTRAQQLFGAPLRDHPDVWIRHVGRRGLRLAHASRGQRHAPGVHPKRQIRPPEREHLRQDPQIVKDLERARL